ncbi:hypothetical protein J437_LFUL005703 [Ladona fulva]|uniref:Uncharacterized protein n=1 Tax=Ladona fulva TaxID=123851 RepID=A0A8K0P2W2_LADFU|nr:hypothetical protein J437_LFUL005703 [Ladona fulva]
MDNNTYKRTYGRKKEIEELQEWRWDSPLQKTMEPSYTEEKARQAEQEELLKLRNETLKGQKTASELRERRKAQMAARLKAARARKREREGLPPEPEESEQDLDQDETLTMWPDCKAAEEAKAEDQEMERRRAKIEEEEERRKKRLEKRPPPVRPWDLGKEGVSGTADLMTQEEWVKKKREERHAEFAPTSELNQTSSTIPEYEYSQKAFPERYKMQKNPFSSQNKAGPSRTSYPHGDDIKKDNIPSSSSFEETDNNTRKRAEIPPPATFEYYGPTSSKQKYKKTGECSNQTSLDDAITAGLHYLRQQAEEREKQKEKGLLGII